MLENMEGGKTVIESRPTSGSMAEIKASIAEAEAKGIEVLFNESLAKTNDAPKIDVQLQTNAPPTPEPKPTADETKQSNLQKFTNPDGSLNLDKVEKSNEHLKRGIEERAAKLLKLNRELNKKFSQTSQELSAQQKAEQDAELSLTEEGKKKILEDLERDPVDAFMKIARTAFRNESAPLFNDVRSMKERHVETSQLKELDDLVSEGHEWILNEGASEFDKIFQERPYLKQSSTPYRDALRFMEFPRSQDSQPTQAQVGPKTPILGASHAVPPASSMPTSTPERELESLNVEMKKALKGHDTAKIRELEAQLDRVYKGMFS